MPLTTTAELLDRLEKIITQLARPYHLASHAELEREGLALIARLRWLK